ncbi:MAG: hypothetical protein R3266_15135 [Gemmatimonadota bacterium]|nr:hypothetical protein [Gemmatimonadota bacterium]
MMGSQMATTWRGVASCLAMAALVLGTYGPAAAAGAQDAAPRIVVDGTDWMESTSIQRQAFLVGVANMIVAEGAWARRHGGEMPPVSERVTRAVSDMKLHEIEERISRWYEANPDRLSMPVMGVVWKDIVGR